MANVIDFHALGHEFSPARAHGASFARSTESSSADAMWLYRFDAKYVEARDLFSSKDHVFASLSATEIRQQLRSLLGSNAFEIANVQDAYIGEKHLLVIVISVIEPVQDHILVWDPLTLHLQLLLTAPHLVTAITVATDQATMVSHRLVKRWSSSLGGGSFAGGTGGGSPVSPVSPTWPSMMSPSSPPATFASPYPYPLPHDPHDPSPELRDVKENNKDSSLIINPVGGRRSSSISSSSTTSFTQDTAAVDEHRRGRDSKSDTSMAGVTRQPSVRLTANNRRKLLILGHSNGSVTVYKFKITELGEVTCATITAIAAISAQGPGTFPTIVAGTKAGFVAILNTSGKGNMLKVDVDDLGSKKLPIQDITLVPTSDKAVTLLAVCQGFIRGSTAHNEKPCVSIYHLRLNHSDFLTLGYVQPDVEPGMVVSGGKTLAATVSDDRHGLLVHCAFRVDLNHQEQQSSLKTVRVGRGEIEVVDKTTLRVSGHSGNLLDISPVMNTNELQLLYLNKLESYIPAFRPADESSSTSVKATLNAKDEAAQRQRWVPESSHWIEDDITATTYTESTRTKIEERRQQMGGKLFFDRLLEFIELPSKPGALYPPRNHAQAKNLWVNIYHNGQLELESRNCLAYYLLKDQTTDVSADFLQQHWISPAFVHLMNGFWALDHFQFKNAVLYLSQPGLTIDWVEEVIRVLLELGSPRLARQLIMSAGLEFNTRSGMSLMMRVLLRSDIGEALNYQRQQRQKAMERRKARKEQAATTTAGSSDDTEAVVLNEEQDEDKDGFVLSQAFYEELFGQLLAFCFEGDDSSNRKPNKEAIHDLSRQTLSRYEEQALIRYGESHPANSQTRIVCWEFLAMYYVRHSCFLEAIGVHQRLLEDELNMAGNDDDIKSKSEKRQEMIRQLKDMLPEPQIKLLEVQEEERLRHKKTNGLKKTGEESTMDVDSDDELAASSTLAVGRDNNEEGDSGRRILTNTTGYHTGTMKGLLDGWVELQRDLEKVALIKAKAEKSNKEQATTVATPNTEDSEDVAPRKPFESLWKVDADRYLHAWQHDLLATKRNQ
ncbi:hypothetical protein BGW41_000787 [Actinomortierella wolfii]|nr:hypothetical protein BGW41_000787 [Actinomortierella wolfii]